MQPVSVGRVDSAAGTSSAGAGERWTLARRAVSDGRRGARGERGAEHGVHVDVRLAAEQRLHVLASQRVQRGQREQQLAVQQAAVAAARHRRLRRVAAARRHAVRMCRTRARQVLHAVRVHLQRLQVRRAPRHANAAAARLDAVLLGAGARGRQREALAGERGRRAAPGARPAQCVRLRLASRVRVRLRRGRGGRGPRDEQTLLQQRECALRVVLELLGAGSRGRRAAVGHARFRVSCKCASRTACT